MGLQPKSSDRALLCPERRVDALKPRPEGVGAGLWDLVAEAYKRVRFSCQTHLSLSSVLSLTQTPAESSRGTEQHDKNEVARMIPIGRQGTCAGRRRVKQLRVKATKNSSIRGLNFFQFDIS